MTKKLLSGLLVAFMLLTLFPATVFAADEPDTSWYIGHEITLTTPAQLAGVVVLCNADTSATGTPFSNKTVKLGADIDLTGYDWTPIWWNAGTFDGQGHAITGLNVTDGVMYRLFETNRLFGGLFGLIMKGSTVSKFTVSSSVDFAGEGQGVVPYGGGVVGYNIGCIVNVGSNVNVTISGKGEFPSCYAVVSRAIPGSMIQAAAY